MMNYWPVLRSGGLLLAGVALVPFSAGAQAPNTVTTPVPAVTSVSRVEIAGDSQQATVRVEGSGNSGDMTYQVSKLMDPPRVVVDFSNARLSTGHNAIPSNYEPVRGVRLGQYRPDEVRVVIDLQRPAEFSIEKKSHEFTLTFAKPDAAPADVATGPNALPANTLGVSAKRLVSIQKKAGDSSAEPRDLPLPALLTGKDAAMATPRQLVARAAAAQVAQAPAGVPAGIPAGLPTPQAGGQAPEQAAYSGEPISVNLKDVDLKDFFRLIHEISGLNVVLDPSVRGKVTLVLDEVPWDQALDIVLSNNGLSKELDGNVLRIVTQDTLRHEAEAMRDLVKAQSDAVQPDNRDARAELRQGQRIGCSAQAISVCSRGRYGHRSLEYADHPRHSRFHAGGR